MHASVARLTQLLRRPVLGGDQVDWSNVETEVGFSFPEDYKEFMEVYGGGSIDYFLSIFSLEREFADWLGEYEFAPQMLLEDLNGLVDTCPLPLEAGVGGMVLWGVSAGPDFCFWDATDPDPNCWQVVLFNSSASRWWRYEVGMVDFLYGLTVRSIESNFNSLSLPQP